MPKFDVPQILISSAAIFGIGLVWYDFNKKVYETVFDLLEVTLCETAEEKARRIKKSRGGDRGRNKKNRRRRRRKDRLIYFKLLFLLISTAIMSDNKLVKTVVDAATITGLAAGIGWAAKKVVKGNFTSDPSSSAMNYVKFTAVMASSIALKQYLEDQKILLASV